MSDKFLKIPISRFEASKVFSCDVFLHLVLNGRYVRLASAGDEMSPAMLARMIEKGVASLCVPTNGQEGLDPNTISLYAAPPVTVEATASAPLVSNTVVEPGEASFAPNPSPPEEAITVASAPEENIPEQTFSADSPVELTSQSFSASPPEKPEEIHIAGSPPPEKLEEIHIAGAPSPEEPEQVFGNTAEAESEGNELLARLKSTLLGEKLAKETEAFHEKLSALPVKERKKLRREFTALSEASDRVNSNRVDASLERKYSVASEIAEFQALGTSAATPDLLVRASERIVKALKTLDVGRAQLIVCGRLITESEEFRESVALTRLGKISGGPPKTEKEKTALADDVKNSVMVNRISEEILKFSASHEEEGEQRFSPELASLERALETVSAGGALPEEIENRFSADEEAKELITVFSNSGDDAAKKIAEHVKVTSDRRDQAMEELHSQRNDGSLVRAKSHRDLPATVSRLAAYLGYSLGYTNLNLLSDLALTAVLHFAQKEEEVRFSKEAIPPFVQAVMEKNPSTDFVAGDAQEIIQVIDAYISNPECDRQQKDFVKRVFDQTVEALAEESKPLDAINLAKWSKFVERGADLTGHSICVKASASAIKLSKSVII